MSDDGLMECRLCGKRWRSLGHHLRHGHDMSANEYRDRFGIRRSTPLTSPATRDRMSDAFKATIAAGKLDGHFASNGDRAQAAGLAGLAAKRKLRDAGVELPQGVPPIPRAIILTIVEAIEAGVKVATAVNASPISATSFHAGLRRHPDLRDRIDALRPTIGRLRQGGRLSA